jgi:hypothetical protein
MYGWLMAGLLPMELVAVRLADEGVPLRAIARATHIPSAELRDRFRDAKEEGQLVDLPKEDWPPGFPRDQRALQLSRMVTQNPEAMTLALHQLFQLTPTEIGLIMLLLQHTTVPKERFNMVHRTIDVHMCRIRHRLEPFGIAITTLWGHGYQIDADSRRRIMDLILKAVEQGDEIP